jgi:hypothetical protein
LVGELVCKGFLNLKTAGSERDNILPLLPRDRRGNGRDVIFISFTYGQGEVGGRVYQRFGPINSDVGWRRLNVLCARSKKRQKMSWFWLLMLLGVKVKVHS